MAKIDFKGSKCFVCLEFLAVKYPEDSFSIYTCCNSHCIVYTITPGNIIEGGFAIFEISFNSGGSYLLEAEFQKLSKNLRAPFIYITDSMYSWYTSMYTGRFDYRNVSYYTHDKKIKIK
jgi:hypothetical protein